MRAYCKILNQETGLVQKGEGCPDEYYQEIGMEIRDIKQSEVDGEWYLTEKCPEKPELTPEDINNLTMTPLDFINFLRSCGLSLSDIKAYLAVNEELDTQLTYCQNVYCGVAKSVMPITFDGITITADMVEQAFKNKYGL